MNALRRSPGTALDPAVRRQGERRLGYDLSRVRIHADPGAGQAAEGLGARAYTVGQHIAFAPGAYQPSTSQGQTLLSHELVHTVQQGTRPLPAGRLDRAPRSHRSEVEARQLAGTVDRPGALGRSRTFDRPQALERPGPIAPQPLAIACDDDLRELAQAARKAVRDSLFVDAMKQIGTPQFHKEEVIRFVDNIDVEYLKRAVNLLGNRTLDDIAASPSGHEVLQHILDRLPPGASERAVIESIFESRGTGPKALPVTTANPDDTAAIDRINRAIDADPRKADYMKARIPLRFPVEIYTAGRAEDGGVYYDRNFGEAGEVPARSFKATIGVGKDRQVTTQNQYPLLFIKLGPSVLGFTDTFIQATVRHEFQHYTRFNEFRAEESGKSADTKLLEQEAELGGGSPLESHETEATSVEIADYGSRMTDDELKSNLLYLGRYLSGALPDFRNQAIDRIVASAATPAARQRMIKVIDGIREKARKAALKPLREKLAAAPVTAGAGAKK